MWLPLFPTWNIIIFDDRYTTFPYCANEKGMSVWNLTKSFQTFFQPRRELFLCKVTSRVSQLIKFTHNDPTQPLISLYVRNLNFGRTPCEYEHVTESAQKVNIYKTAYHLRMYKTYGTYGWILVLTWCCCKPSQVIHQAVSRKTYFPPREGLFWCKPTPIVSQLNLRTVNQCSVWYP